MVKIHDMKILIACGSFKDVYSPIQICQLIGNILLKGHFKKERINIDILPIADGGEHTSEIIQYYHKTDKIVVKNIINPTGKIDSAFYLKTSKLSAFIESANILRLKKHLNSQQKKSLYH